MKPDDHDLLIRVDENVKNLGREFSLLRDGSISKISSLETMKLDKEDFTSYKKDIDITINLLFKSIDTLKKYIYIGMGIILALQFIALIVASNNRP